MAVASTLTKNSYFDTGWSPVQEYLMAECVLVESLEAIVPVGW